MYVGFVHHSPRLTFLLSQENVLIDAEGNPRLTDFGHSSITKNLDSINASTPNTGGTVRYCAPERLDSMGDVRGNKRKPTNKSDVYSLSMVITEVRLFYESARGPGSDFFASSLRPERCRFPNTMIPTSLFWFRKVNGQQSLVL